MSSFKKYIKEQNILSEMPTVLTVFGSNLKNPKGETVNFENEYNYDLTQELLNNIDTDNNIDKTVNITNFKDAPHLRELNKILKYGSSIDFVFKKDKKIPIWDKERNEIFMIDKNHKSYFVTEKDEPIIAEFIFLLYNYDVLKCDSIDEKTRNLLKNVKKLYN